MVEVITIVMSVGSVLSVSLHLSQGFHKLEEKQQDSLITTALSASCLTTAKSLSRLQTLLLQQYSVLCAAARTRPNWMASFETTIIGVASTLSVLDAELCRQCEEQLDLSPDVVLDDTVLHKIEQQIRGHILSLDFLIESLQLQVLPTMYLENPQNAMRLEELKRRASDARIFRDSELKGKRPEIRPEFDAELIVTFESTETFRVRKEQLVATQDDRSEPQFSLEVIERLFQVTRECTQSSDKHVQDFNGGFGSTEKQFQIELRDSRPYQKAGFSFHRKTEAFKQESPVPSVLNLTINTETGRGPMSTFMGSDFRYNQGYGRYQAYSLLEKISVISEPREVMLHVLISKQYYRAVSEMLEEGADPQAVGVMGIGTQTWSYPPPIPALAHAAILGNTKIVELLLSRGSLLDACIGDKKTALTCATIEGRANIVKILLAHGASTDHKDDSGRTPLLHASWRGHDSIVNSLLENGAHVDARSLVEKETPLHEAIARGHIAVVATLLRHNASMKLMSSGYQAIHTAALNDQAQAIELLVGKGCSMTAVTDSERWTPLHVAIANNNFTSLQTLIRLKANIEFRVTYTGYTPLEFAASRGNAKVVECLLEAGAKTGTRNSEGFTPLSIAIQSGHLDWMSTLIKYGVDPNRFCNKARTPLHYATDHGYTNIITELLKSGAMPAINKFDRYGWTPLHFATRGGHVEAAAELLAHGAKVDMQMEPDHTTTLWFAVNENRIDMVSLLLRNGASPNLHRRAEPSNHLPLHAAARNAFDEVCGLLLDNGAEVDIEDDVKATPLHYAALQGHVPTMMLLFERGANIDHADIYGFTALHISLSTEEPEVACWGLIKYGANVNPKSLRGVTPLHAAALKGHKKIVLKLLEMGADKNALANRTRQKASGSEDEGAETAADIARGAGHHDIAKAIDSYS